MKTNKEVKEDVLVSATRFLMELIVVFNKKVEEEPAFSEDDKITKQEIINKIEKYETI